jgi:hypothetical protein
MLGLDPHGVNAELTEEIDHVRGVVAGCDSGDAPVSQLFFGAIFSHD